jgi:hypothetical protein
LLVVLADTNQELTMSRLVLLGCALIFAGAGLGCGGEEPAPGQKPSAAQGPSLITNLDCNAESYFQCGLSFTCDAGVVKGSWHEHVFEDEVNWTGERIVRYECTAACASGVCSGDTSWPDDPNADGAAWVQHLCRP